MKQNGFSGKCRFCQSPLEQSFVDLGMSPLCQDHVKFDELNRMEPFYPLHAYVCSHCFLVSWMSLSLHLKSLMITLISPLILIHGFGITKPYYVFILPWNLKEEIMENMSFIKEWGGKFVIPIPELTVYDPKWTLRYQRAS